MANHQDPDREILYATEQEMRGFASATHDDNRKVVSHELIEKIWRIDNSTAKSTIRTTTQLNRQKANSKLSRNFGTNDCMLRYRIIKSYFFTDTFFVTNKSSSSKGYTCMQIFGAIIAESHKYHKSKQVQQFCHKIGTTLRVIEGLAQWDNRAELYVGLFKEAVRKYILQENSPLVL